MAQYLLKTLAESGLMQRTLRTIQRAIRATSATLVLIGAGCAESDRADDGGPGEGPDPRDASTMMDARVPSDAHVATDGRVDSDALVRGDGSILLAAFPLDALVCTGPELGVGADGGLVGGYVGQCCAEAMCYVPEPGAECDPVEAGHLARFFFGSGLCNCGDIEGPYARPEIDVPTQGECCYAVPVIGCEGRPLSTDRGHLLASVVSSVDWIT